MTYYLDPFGCVKNQVDAENMMAFLNRAGWVAAENADNADLIIINSCGFIESAKQESINAVLNWRKLYPEKKILLAGCLAQRYAKELAASLPEADGLFGVSDPAGIVRAAALTVGTGPSEKRRGDPEPGAGGCPETGERPGVGEQPGVGDRPLLSLPGSAYVKISEGCNNRCSFCAIPLIRGGLRSRPVSEISLECKTLLGRGIKELCLIGQDSGSYGRDLAAPGTDAAGAYLASDLSPGLPGLMEALSRLEGNFWVRPLYIHPDNFPQSVLSIMERDKRFLPYFDIPFQHGSEKILRLMNRRGNAAAYLDLIETIRSIFPDAAIRSTFMTGFPGETEEDFEMLLDFQKKAMLDWLGCFAYSREEDTQAWNIKGRVAKKIALERKRLIEERQIPITEKRMERFIGRVFDVLVEEKFEAPAEDTSFNGNKVSNANKIYDETSLYLGRLPFQAPEVDGAAVITSPKLLKTGELISCRVFARSGFDLQVRPV